jgi:phospholipid-binding lipoprotein MlaA
MNNKRQKISIFLFYLIVLSSTVFANATETPDTAQQSTYTKDPLERFNRVMFTFNDKLDIYIMKPIAKFYNTIMPKPLNQGVHNFFNNIGELPTIANDVLQFNFYQFTNDLWRLGINTTIGIGGLFDIATRMGLPYYDNDFGLTLAHWGYTESTYLVLPFFGPNTIRDGIGMPVDYYGFSIYPYITPQSASYELYGLGVIDSRAQLLQFQPMLEEVAIDKYVFIRNAYMQHRTYQIEQNRHLGVMERNKETASNTSQ